MKRTFGTNLFATRLFRPTLFGGEVVGPPDPPTLSVRDDRDGTGATATLADVPVGRTVQVYVQQVACCETIGTWTLAGSRVGNGTLALDLPLGHYYAYALVTTPGGQALSNLVAFRVTERLWSTFVPEPCGPLSVPMARLAADLAICPSVLEQFGTDDPLAALDRIYYPDIETDDILAYLPCIVVGFGDSVSWQSIAGGAKNYLRPEVGVLSLELAAEAHQVQHETDQRMTLRSFTNWVGCVLRELAELAGQDQHLAITQIQQEIPPMACGAVERDSSGTYYWARYLINWN